MRTLVPLLCVLLLCAAPVVAGGMEIHLDEEADFAAFRTYRWIDGAPAGKGGVQRQIVASVNAQMQGRGLESTEAAAADLDVATYVLTDTNVDLWSATATTSWGRVWSVQVRDITEGTLVVRVTRAGTQDMVFHAMVQQVIDKGMTSQQIERKVDRIIDKMFRKYPRPAKK